MPYDRLIAHKAKKMKWCDFRKFGARLERIDDPAYVNTRVQLSIYSASLFSDLASPVLLSLLMEAESNIDITCLRHGDITLERATPGIDLFDYHPDFLVLFPFGDELVLENKDVFSTSALEDAGIIREYTDREMSDLFTRSIPIRNPSFPVVDTQCSVLLDGKEIRPHKGHWWVEKGGEFSIFPAQAGKSSFWKSCGISPGMVLKSWPTHTAWASANGVSESDSLQHLIPLRLPHSLSLSSNDDGSYDVLKDYRGLPAPSESLLRRLRVDSDLIRRRNLSTISGAISKYISKALSSGPSQEERNALMASVVDRNFELYPSDRDRLMEVLERSGDVRSVSRPYLKAAMSELNILEREQKSLIWPKPSFSPEHLRSSPCAIFLKRLWDSIPRECLQDQHLGIYRATLTGLHLLCLDIPDIGELRERMVRIVAGMKAHLYSQQEVISLWGARAAKQFLEVNRYLAIAVDECTPITHFSQPLLNNECRRVSFAHAVEATPLALDDIQDALGFFAITGAGASDETDLRPRLEGLHCALSNADLLGSPLLRAVTVNLRPGDGDAMYDLAHRKLTLPSEGWRVGFEACLARMIDHALAFQTDTLACSHASNLLSSADHVASYPPAVQAFICELNQGGGVSKGEARMFSLAAASLSRWTSTVFSSQIGASPIEGDDIAYAREWVFSLERTWAEALLYSEVSAIGEGILARQIEECKTMAFQSDRQAQPLLKPEFTRLTPAEIFEHLAVVSKLFSPVKEGDSVEASLLRTHLKSRLSDSVAKLFLERATSFSAEGPC